MDGSGDGVGVSSARWYDARNASWLSEDPLADIDSPNLYGKTFDVEPGDVVLLAGKNDSNSRHVVIVGGFKEKMFGKPDALIFENTPQDRDATQDFHDNSPHTPTLVNSNSSAAGSNIWNAENMNVAEVAQNRQQDGTPFTEGAVANAVSAVGPVTYTNQSASGSVEDSACDCAGFVNQVLDELGGTLSPYSSPNAPKGVGDWFQDVVPPPPGGSR